MRAFWTGVAIMLVIAGVIWLGHDYLQEKTDINNPDSRVGEVVDDALLPIQHGRTYLDMKSKAGKLELLNIRTAILDYYMRFDENPSSLQDLVDTGCIPEAALQDAFRQDYRLREVDGRMMLISSGTDQILGTDDDITLDVSGTMMEVPRPPDTTDAQPQEPATSSGRSLDMIQGLGSN